MPAPPPRPARLLFLPGAAGAAAFWAPVAARLQSAWARELLSWPGLGAEPPDPRVSSLDDLVARVLERLDRPSALVAQSLGGAIALRVTAERPELVTHLVLVATSAGLGAVHAASEDWRAAYRAEFPGAAPWVTAVPPAELAGDLSDRLAGVRAPALLIWGDADPLSPPSVGERLARLLPRATLHVVPDSDHDLAMRHPAHVADLIHAHLTPSQVATGSVGT